MPSRSVAEISHLACKFTWYWHVMRLAVKMLFSFDTPATLVFTSKFGVMCNSHGTFCSSEDVSDTSSPVVVFTAVNNVTDVGPLIAPMTAEAFAVAKKSVSPTDIPKVDCTDWVVLLAPTVTIVSAVEARVTPVWFPVEASITGL
jgi:hypothetical protein